jgi:hypothetical protein
MSRLSAFRSRRSANAASTSGNAALASTSGAAGSASSSSFGSFSSFESFPPPNQLAQRNYGASLRRDTSEDDEDPHESPIIGSRRTSRLLDAPPTPRSAKRLKTYSTQVCSSLNLEPDALDSFIKVLSCLINFPPLFSWKMWSSSTSG